jgi:Domain of unknown function (DUF1995)
LVFRLLALFSPILNPITMSDSTSTLPELPQTLDMAIDQARTATQAALTAGYCRLQVELLFPELKPMPVAEQYLSQFADLGKHLKVFFADAGAAALARREWGEVPFQIRGVAELVEPVQPEDQGFVFVAPTPVEVFQIEAMAQKAAERPFVLLNPKLQDVSIVGIGYAGRQLRERFLNTIEPCYYLRPLEGAAVMRAYPFPWQIWLEESDGDYRLVATETERPSTERLEAILSQTSGSDKASAAKPSLLANMQRFLRALSQ